MQKTCRKYGGATCRHLYSVSKKNLKGSGIHPLLMSVLDNVISIQLRSHVKIKQQKSAGSEGEALNHIFIIRNVTHWTAHRILLWQEIAAPAAKEEPAHANEEEAKATPDDAEMPSVPQQPSNTSAGSHKPDDTGKDTGKDGEEEEDCEEGEEEEGDEEYPDDIMDIDLDFEDMELEFQGVSIYSRGNLGYHVA